MVRSHEYGAGTYYGSFLPKVTIDDAAICIGKSVTISDKAPGTGKSYQWNDASELSTLTVSPIVTTTYSVTATLAGCTASDEAVVTVNPLPVISFTPSGTIGCIPQQITFKDNTSPVPVSYLWNFGDSASGSSNTSVSSHPSHTFIKQGKYSISLSATTNAGCVADSAFDSLITVNPLPTANFFFNPGNPSNFSPDVTFADLSLGKDITSWSWDFADTASADANRSGDQNPVTGLSIRVLLMLRSGLRIITGARMNLLKKFLLKRILLSMRPMLLTGTMMVQMMDLCRKASELMKKISRCLSFHDGESRSIPPKK